MIDNDEIHFCFYIVETVFCLKGSFLKNTIDLHVTLTVMIKVQGVMRMEYTIQKLAHLAGVSTRTLRYYDEVGLLKPARLSSSGYRIYGSKEVDRLQQILFYRALDVGIDEIKQILLNPSYDELKALNEHYQKLLEKKAQLELMIENIELTIASKKGEKKMSHQDKFKGLKQQLLQENEQKYGDELRQTYGNKKIEASNIQFTNLSEEAFNEMKQLGEAILKKLSIAMQSNNPQGNLAQEVAKMHHRWLTYTWPSYSKEAHAGLAQMYVADERFTSYYDEAVRPGAAQFLCDAILCYTSHNQ